MQLVLSAVFLGALLLGCEGPKSPDDSGDPSDTDSGTGEGGLPDLISDADTTGCEGATDSDGVFHEVPGAVSYFVGVYEQGGDTWSGEEIWYLFANPAWVESGEEDCQIHYAATASEGTASACPSCDLALDVTLTLDVTLSDCPEELYQGTDGTVSYGVKYTSDTEVDWYFGSSGNELGSGYYTDGAMNYITSKACKYF